MQVSNSNGKITVFEDHEGSHIEPLLHMGVRDAIKWSHISNVKPIIEFLQAWSKHPFKSSFFFFGLFYHGVDIFVYGCYSLLEIFSMENFA